jgi:hypothetical protein
MSLPKSLSPFELSYRTTKYVRENQPYLFTDKEEARAAYIESLKKPGLDKNGPANFYARYQSPEVKTLEEAEKAVSRALKDAEAKVSQEPFTQEERNALYQSRA